MASVRVLVLGDVMLDRYYFADVSRISPEGPVPVALVRSVSNQPGGAANVAHNLARLGCRVSVAGVTGEDGDRQILDREFNAMGITHAGLLRTQRPTTTKVRVIGGHQQMLRLDFEDSVRVAPALEQRLKAYLQRQLDAGLDAVILSDYAKGVCTPGLCRSAIEACRRHGVPLIVDPKGASWQKYKDAFLVTPNLRELGEVCRTAVNNDDGEIERRGKAIRSKFGFGSLLVTRSEKGLSLVSGNPPLHVPACAREVFDVCGAGDTVVAVMGAALAAGLEPAAAARLANLAAGVVVGKVGTYAIRAAELEEALGQQPRPGEWQV